MLRRTIGAREVRPWRPEGGFYTFVVELEMSWLTTLQRWASQAHVWMYRKTGGRLVSMGHRLVLVTTTGAKSHEPRTSPLVAFANSEGWVVVAAAGGDHSPGWYHNMVANADVIVERNASKKRMVAYEAVGPEREALWERIIAEEPSFASFQRKTERVIPVMVLEPAVVGISPAAAPVTSGTRARANEEGSKT